ncbi:hypothetical protein D3C85_714420 [compost metagenome]
MPGGDRLAQVVAARRVVVDDQDAQIAEGVSRPGGDVAGQAWLQREREHHLELAAAAERAFETDGAAHEGYQPFRNRQPQARATKAAGDGAVGLGEGCEQARLLLGGNADAGIANAEAQLDGFALAVRPLHHQSDLPLFGELDGVADQVDQHLLQALGITDERQRHIGLDPDHQLQVLVRGVDRHHRGQRTEHIVQAERRRGDRQVPGLQLGEVQHVIENHQQGFACAPEHLQVLALVGGEGGARQQLGDAQHGVHRGADLVAHAGDEFAFCTAGHFRAFHGISQLLCRFLFLADVLGNAEKADDLLGRVSYGGDRELHRKLRTILAHVGPFVRFGTALTGDGDQRVEATYRGVQQLAQLGGASVHFLANMQHGQTLPIDEFGVAIAEHSLRPGVEDLDGAVDIGGDDRELAGRIHQGAKADLGFGEGDGQLLGERLGVFTQCGQVPHHEEKQEADERAADQHDDRFLAVYRRFEGR